MANLRIGDIIALRHMKPHDGWLAAEGILSEDLTLTKELNNFENCLWEVTVQNQYNAVKEYEDKILQSRKDDEDEISPPQEGNGGGGNGNDELHEFYEHFLIASTIENKLNERLMALKTGKPVVFGDVIQLRHVKTRGFLTISSNQLAKHEKENMRIEIDSNGDPLSWLEFMPRFKYDKEGQQIVHENECHIRVHERPSEFIHAARKISKFSTNGNREINCSLENSVWTISIYQQCWEAKSKNILSGQLILLQGVETSTFVTLSEQSPGKTESADLIMSNPIHLSISSIDGHVGTNLLWMIESENPLIGGAVSEKDKKFALRDLTSGLYMKMNTDGTMVGVNHRDNCSFFEFPTAHLLDSEVGIVDGSLVHLSSENKWISLGQTENVEMRCSGASDRSLAVSIVVTSKLAQHLGPQVYACGDVTRIIRKFYLLSKKCDRGITGLNIDSELRTVLSALEYLSSFLSTDHNSGDNFSDTFRWTAQSFDHGHLKAVVEHSSAVVLITRQTIVREQGVLDVILDLLELINQSLSSDQWSEGSELIRSILSEGSTERSESFRGMSARKSAKGSGLLKSRSDEFGNGEIKSQNAGNLATLCLSALFHCIKGNHVNQMLVADRFTVLLTQVQDYSLCLSLSLPCSLSLLLTLAIVGQESRSGR
jgi:hypothetical protein